jgi:hypothetical protein
MDPVYREIFAQLYYSAYREPVFYPFAERWEYQIFPQVSWVRRAIDEIEIELASERKLRLRADAKFLLLINLSEMIMRPVLAGGRVRFEEFQVAVRDDINLLITDAASQRGEEPEISGHALIDALSRNWRKLKLTDLKIWE